MRLADKSGAVQALAHGAVHGHQRHGADEFGGIGALPGGLQQLRQFTCADAFVTRQAGTILDHQVRGGNALARHPATDHSLGCLGIVAIGLVAELRAETQKQLTGHGVVTVFVDVTDDLHQIRGEGPREQAGLFRYIGEAILAEDLAAQFLPDSPHGAGRIARMVEQGQIGLGAAALGQFAADDHGGAVELFHRVVAHIRPAGAFAGRQGLDPIVDADLGNRWLDCDVHLAAVGARDEAQCLEVDQQGVGGDQIRFVGVAAVIVEGRQSGLVEVAAVKYQVAAYLVHTVGAQVAEQQPEALHVQLGVATAFEEQVAVQHAVFQRTVGVELGFPLVRRAEQLQRGKGGHQLHG